jgi:hypothetical protein
MSHARPILRTALIALTIFLATAGTTSSQLSPLTIADSTGQHDNYDAG